MKPSALATTTTSPRTRPIRSATHDSSSAPPSTPEGVIESLGYHVFSTLQAPIGWSQERDLNAGTPAASPQEFWEKTTGIKLADSHFTVIVPIHNEAHGLSTFLGALSHSFVPQGVDLRLIFVTNGCSDDSPEQLQRFLARLRLQAKSKDAPNSGYSALHEAKVGSVTYAHIDTNVPGKAHAIFLGNQEAKRFGHRVVMNLDADCCLERFALMKMFGNMQAAIDRDGPVPTVISATSSIEWDKARHLSPAERVQHQGRRTEYRCNKDSVHVYGPLMAWDSAWLDTLGLAFAAVIEDYSIGLHARLAGGKLLRSEAHGWTYRPATRADYWGMLQRFAQGAFQLIERHKDNPEAVAMIRRDNAYVISPREILRDARSREINLRHPVRAARAAYHAARGLWALARGYLDARAAGASAQTWLQLSSTKL